MDKVENSTLESLFDYKKKQLHCSTRMSRMFQLIPVQFSEMVSHIGFHAEYAPPEGTIVRLHIAFDNLVNDRFLRLQLQPYRYIKVRRGIITNNSFSCVSSVYRPSIWTGHLLCRDSEKGHGSVEGAEQGVSALCGGRGTDRELHPW